MSFIGGAPIVHQRIAEHAQEWTRHAKIRFSFVESGGDVRIGFTCTGNWSLVGTEACGIAASRATMNFARLRADSSDADYRFYVLHEFGHALGCVHEHQSPVAGLPWNKPVVYEFYSRCYGWDTAKVDRNIFDRYAANQTQFTAWDSASIMQYPVEAGLLLDGHPGIPRNESLSETDRRFIAAVYP